MRRKDFKDWLSEDTEASERIARLTRGLPKPYRRERARDPEEARLLLERGTPERLIGRAEPPGERRGEP